MDMVANSPRTLSLHADDNVLVAVDPIPIGAGLPGGVVAASRVPRGHKLSARGIAAGEPILKFGQIIGFASADIPPCVWVHEHNVVMSDFARDYAFGADAERVRVKPADAPATFEGYRRANGKAGTRNYIGILTSVNCSASVAMFMAEAVRRSGLLDDYPNVERWFRAIEARPAVVRMLQGWMPPEPGMLPTRASVRPSFALSDATRMSQARASSSPPPSA